MNDISNIEFKGHLIPQGFSSLKLEICEICNKNPPTWIETRGMGDLSEYRITCNECHSKFLSEVEHIEEQTKIEDFSIYDQLPLENQDVTPTERPAWMQEFIEEGQAEGTLTTLDPVRESTIENDISIEDTTDALVQIKEDNKSSWSADFVKQALFGSNPEDWLNSQGAYTEDEIDNTIKTLGSFYNNNVGSIKLSAILCLNGAINRFKNKSSEIKIELEKYANDNEETVQNYAKDILNKLK